MKIKSTILVLTSMFVTQFSLAQTKIYEKVINDSILTENAVRVVIGLQRSFYSEIGFSRHKSNKSPKCGFGGDVPRGYYSALEWTAKTKNYKDVFGIKIGYENLASLFATAIEVKYVTNFEQKDFVITPKIGFGNSDFKWNIFYGYNISTNGYPFPNVGRHQFSVVFNLDKDTFVKEKSGD